MNSSLNVSLFMLFLRWRVNVFLFLRFFWLCVVISRMCFTYMYMRICVYAHVFVCVWCCIWINSSLSLYSHNVSLFILVLRWRVNVFFGFGDFFYFFCAVVCCCVVITHTRNVFAHVCICICMYDSLIKSQWVFNDKDGWNIHQEGKKGFFPPQQEERLQ